MTESVEKSIAFLKRPKLQNSGVYIIVAQHYLQEDADVDMLVKIGLAGTLSHRLDSYLLYFLLGFHVFSLIFCDDENDARRTESSIHSYLNNKQVHVTTDHSHQSEWFYMSRHDIDKLLTMVQKNKSTTFPLDYSIKKNRGLLVFPYKSIEKSDIFISANPQMCSDRIKPLFDNLKEILDSKVKDPITTGPIKIKKTKKLSKKKSSVKKKLEF